MFAADGPSVAFGRELAWGLLAGGVLYFGPTLLALIRNRGAAPLTFYANLLLGWTGVGWVLAWVVALTDRRLRVYVTSVAVRPSGEPALPPKPPTVTLAPDGRHWWDGRTWHDGWQVQPSGALNSPDGARWFSGTEWVTIGVADPRPDGFATDGRWSPNDS